MKVLVIGGTGHIGQFLVPLLVEHGFQVSVLSRGNTQVQVGDAWKAVQFVEGDAGDPAFDPKRLHLDPEVVIEFPGHLGNVVSAFEGRGVRHFIACGSLWMYGKPTIVPTPEQFFSPCRAESYARRFEELQSLFEQYRDCGPALTAIMPPNICGPGKVPLEAHGGRSLDVHRAHRAGEKVFLPDGPEALIGPCDAEDIAACFLLAANKPEQSRGQMFNVGSAYALTASQFVRAYADIYGSQIPIERIPWEQYTTEISPDWGAFAHFENHMCPDIRKAGEHLGYNPKYTPEQSMERAVRWMFDERLL